MARKKASLEKREEIEGKDLDGDGEQGESPAHRAKVFGIKKGATTMAKKNPFGAAPAPAGDAAPTNTKKGALPPFMKGAASSDKTTKGSKGASKMCPACVKGGKSSCSHM